MSVGDGPEPADDSAATPPAGDDSGHRDSDTAATPPAEGEPDSPSEVPPVGGDGPDIADPADPGPDRPVGAHPAGSDGPPSARSARITHVPGNPTFAAQPYPGEPVGLPWGFLAFFVGLGGFYLASLVITAAVNPNAAQSSLRGPAVLLALLPNLLLGLGPAIFAWRRGAGPRVDFRVKFTRSDVSTGLTCGVVSLAVGLLINLVLEGLVFHGRAQQGVAQELGQLSGGRSGWLVVALLYVVLIAPLNEEMLMRGALWGALEHYRLPRLAILALTALVFAFLHAEPALTVALFGQGLVIGVARMRSGGIGASIVAHATNNFLPAVVLWFSSKP